MALIVYAFFLFGSFPAGYLLLRTGFPLTQKLNTTKKLVLSYLIGGLVFGAPIITVQYLEINPNYYLLLSLGLLTAFFAVMLTKRIALGEADPFTFQKEKKKSLQIPSKLKEEKTEKQKPIVFEQGLMVKTKEDTKGKQVFKEKENNIQSTTPAKNNEKNEALERLRKFAQEIKKNPQKSKGGPEEIEEDLLSNLSDEDSKEEEEEY